MLDYTEIVEGTLTPAKEPYCITSILNDIITMTVMQSSKHQLEMVFDIDPKIPSVLIGDAEKISHLLKILVENSIKFTEEGGINVCVKFRPESYGINLIINIYDTGIGMTDSQLIQMCDDFYQADSEAAVLPAVLVLDFRLPEVCFMLWVDLFILTVRHIRACRRISQYPREWKMICRLL